MEFLVHPVDTSTGQAELALGKVLAVVRKLVDRKPATVDNHTAVGMLASREQHSESKDMVVATNHIAN